MNKKFKKWQKVVAAIVLVAFLFQSGPVYALDQITTDFNTLAVNEETTNMDNTANTTKETKEDVKPTENPPPKNNDTEEETFTVDDAGSQLSSSNSSANSSVPDAEEKSHSSILDSFGDSFTFDVNDFSMMDTNEIVDKDVALKGKTQNPSREIITEIPELREPNVKYFVNADGTNTASIYNHDVHYLAKDGSYKEIDNSLLAKKTAAGKDVIANEDSITDFYFAQNATEGNMVSIRTEGYDLKWRLDTSEHKKLKNAKAKIKTNPSVKTLVEDAVEKDDVRDTISSTEYKSIMEDVDLEYVLLGTQIKENIVIHNVDAISDFSFILTSESLYAKKKGKEILFTNENGDIVYTMAEPLMYDANGAESTAIKINLKTISETENAHTYQFTVSPSKKWLTDENRAYPVVVDPTITTIQKATTIEDAHVNSDYPGGNYKTSSALVLGTNSSGHSRAYVKFEIPDEVKKIDNRVISAEMALCPNVSNSYSLFLKDKITAAPTFYAFAPKSSWTSSSITWNNQPSYDTFTTLDYHKVGIESDGSPSLAWATYDITSIVDKWCTGEQPNNGVMIKGTESTVYSNRAYYYSSDWSTAAYKPLIQIAYANMIGLEDYWTYQTHSMGLAGTAYINNFTGSLTTVFQDYSWPAEFLTLGINHVYSSSYANEIPYATTKGDSLNVGLGFRLNLQEQIKPITINGTQLYRYIDADGTQHYFQKIDGVWEDDSGLGLKLQIKPSSAPNGYVVTDKQDNVRVFSATTGYLLSVTDNTGHAITFNYSGSRLQSVSDEAGHIATFVTDSSGLLTKMVLTSKNDSTWRKEISYSYRQGYLVGVTYPGSSDVNVNGSSGNSNYAQFEFGSNGAMAYMRDTVLNRNIVFSYETAFNGKGLRIKDYRINTGSYTTAAASSDNAYTLDYTSHSTRINEVTPNLGRHQVYIFNYNGQTTSAQDEEGNAIYSETGIKDGHQSGDDEKNLNKLTHASKTQKSVINLLKNSTFGDNMDYYTRIGNGTNDPVNDAYIGNHGIMLSAINVTSAFTGIAQTVTVKGGQPYTLSAYVKTENCVSGGGALKLVASNGSYSYSSEFDNIISNDGYQRFETTIEIPNTGNFTLTAYMGLKNTASYVFFSNAQLEAAECASRYNILGNGDFESNLAYWSKDASINSLDGIVACSTIDTNVNTARPNGGNCYKIGGQADASKKISQSILASGKAGDSYVFGCWVKSNGLVNKDQGDGSKQCLGMTIQFHSKNGLPDTYRSVMITPTSDEWQYICGNAAAERDYDRITVYLKFIFNRNYAYFDDVQLYKDTFGQSFTYDKNGNLKSVVDMANTTSHVVTNGNNDVTSYSDGKGQEYALTYDGGSTTLKRHNLTKAVTPDGLTYTYDYDSAHGNMTKAKVNNPSANTVRDIINTFTYSSDGAYLTSTTNQMNNTTTYRYDTNTGLETSRSLPVGMSSNVYLDVNYSYDPNSLFLTQVSGNSASDPKLQYEYTKNTLSQTKWGTDSKYLKYHYTYTPSGDLQSIKQSSSKNTSQKTLESYDYEPGRSLMKSVYYGNSQFLEYEYDNQDRVTSLTSERTDAHESATIVDYVYNSSGLLGKTISYDEGIGIPVTTYNQYDLAERLTGTYNTKGSGVYELSYDKNNLFTGYKSYLRNGSADVNYEIEHTYVEKAGGSTDYGVDKPLMDKVKSGETAYKYDAYGRLSQILSSASIGMFSAVGIQYDYLDIGSSQTTCMPKNINITYPGDLDTDTSYSLSYDRAANITKVDTSLSDGTAYSTNYTYDNLCRLTNVSNINNDGNHYQYNYDERNNILSSTVTNNGSNVSQKQYSYNNDDIDQLSSYSNTTDSGTVMRNYTYDNAGNPVAIEETDSKDNSTRNLTLWWKYGKMLENVNDGGALNSSFYYDADGNLAKKINGDGSYVIYHYNAGKLEYEEHYDVNGVLQNLLKYFYDSNGKVLYLLHKDDHFSDSDIFDLYYYVRNAVGDISELVRIAKQSETGSSWDVALAAHYEYDAYGNILSVENFNGCNIGDLNPIRYKDYQYDQETGWYYLYNRFYDPEIGRFINADAATVPDDYNSNYIYQNRYTYCDDNPVMSEDDNGNVWQFVAAGVIVAGISVVTEMASQIEDYGSVKYAGDVVISAISGFASVWGPIGGAIDIACTAYLATVKYERTGDPGVVNLAEEMALAFLPGKIGDGIAKALFSKLDMPIRAAFSAHIPFIYQGGVTAHSYYSDKSGSSRNSNRSSNSSKNGSRNGDRPKTPPRNAPPLRGMPAYMYH